MTGWEIALIIIGIILAIILFIIGIFYYYDTVNKIIFPAPYPYYHDQSFGNNLKYFQVYKSNGTIGKVVKNLNETNHQNLEMVRAIPYLYLENQIPTQYYCIHFHGNAEDLYAGSQFFGELQKQVKFNTFIIEYPSYGIYLGTNCNAQIIEEDSLQVYDQILKTYNINPDQIFIFGRSIGTGPAFFVASQRKCRGLIVMSAYKSIKAIIKDFCCGFGLLISCFIQERFNNFQRSQHVKSRILLIHGEDDQLIQPHNSNELYINLPKDIKEKSKLSIRPQMTHNEYHFDEDIIDPILEQFPELR